MFQEKMSNPVYQAAVAELEAVLAPRLVSRSLHEGMRQLGKAPDSVAYSDLETILKAQIYRQLQVTMPLTQAKEKVQEILERLQQLDEGASSEAHLEEQRRALEKLQAAAKPLNLYFEWAETQKLRAQLQLIGAEQEDGKETSKLLEAARLQLATVAQKLEDQLVAQARELGDLDASLERVKSLGGPKVRRLETLLNQVHEAQQNHQLASAEVERARKLAADLRKLMGSSVVADELPGTEEGDLLLEAGDDATDSADIDASGLSPEASARLLLLDVESERFELESLEREFANLLGYQPQWAEHFAALGHTLNEQSALGEGLQRFHLELAEAQEKLRYDLRRELSALQDDLSALDEAMASEANLALQIALGILETTLPAESDVQHARNLASLATGQAAELQEGQSAQTLRLQAQGERLAQLEATLKHYKESPLAATEYAALQEALGAARQAQRERRLAPEAVAAASAAAERLEAETAASAPEETQRQRAFLRLMLLRLQALPSEDLLSEGLLENRKDSQNEAQVIRSELHRQLEALERHILPDEELGAAEALLESLEENLQAAIRQRLQAFSEEAAQLGDHELLADLHTMALELDEGRYPAMELLKSELQQSAERRRSEQAGEIHRLEEESQRYRGLEGENVERLEAALSKARAQIEAGQLADTLGRGWSYLSALQKGLAQEVEGFAPRLDKALASFAPLEKLNSEEAATLRRTLQHLARQKEALRKVSPSVQARLLRSLSEAEAQLKELHEAYAATQAIAGQLVTGNLFDDALGLFEQPRQETADAADIAENPLKQRLGSFLSEPGVLGAALFDASEVTCQVGPLEFDPEALNSLAASATALQESLELGAPELLTLETSGRFLLIGWPTAARQVFIVLDNPAHLSGIARRLRRELPHLSELLTLRASLFTSVK